MICKKCGAYNPDHATFCKVCAANLKEQAETDEAAEAVETEETVDAGFRPRQGKVQAPDFSSNRRSDSFKAPLKQEEPEEEDVEDEAEEEEEDVKPAKPSRFAHAAAPVKKRRIVDEEDDYDEEDEDDDYDDEEEEPKPAKKPLFARSAAPAKKRRPVEDEEDEDEDDEEEEDEIEAEKLESEPKTTRFARASSKKRAPVEDYDDEDEDDEDDEEDEDDDEYEEYEPTPPRRKKSGRNQSKSSGGSGIVTLLIVCLLAILLIIVGIVAFCNIKGGAMKSKLPSFLQFNCAGKATTEQPTKQPTEVEPSTEPELEPTEAPVTGNQVDYSATTLEEGVDEKGEPCIRISMISRPGDTVTIVLPNQDDYVVQNNENSDVPYLLTIPKSCFYPHTSLSESVYTVTPQILVTHADGTEETLPVDSFDLTFPTVSLELLEPAPATIPEEGIMAEEGNKIMIKGQVDDHTVTVTVNDQPVTNMYTGGVFEYLYTLTGEDSETVNIEASKNDYVPTSYSFVVTPYIFIPEEMPLTVETNINNLMADKNNKVTVTGTTAPGVTLTATPAADFQSSIACGSPTVDAEGNYSFEVTFDKSYYGIASITIHAKKDGYEEGETTCTVARMYKDRQAAIKGYNKTKSYHEVPTGYAFDKVMENPNDTGFYRFVGKVLEVDPETGVMTFAAKTSNKETVNIYVLSAIAKFDPAKQVGKSFKFYSTLNGLYTDGASLYITAWFQMAD